MSSGVGVSSRICILLLFICSRSITSVGEERPNLSGIVYLLLCGFCSERFPLGAWDGMRYSIVALNGPST